MKIKKIVALLATLAMCIGLLTVPVMAEGDAWSDNADTDWYTGHENDTVFTLSTGAQLAGLAQLVNAGSDFNKKTIKLDADIDLDNQEWTPIGTASYPFMGYFDGQNYTIKNLKINRPDMDYVGLFGYCNLKDVIPAEAVGCKDLTIENVSIVGKQHVGAVVGNALNSVWQNITVKGTIQISGNYYVGGIVGYSYIHLKNIKVEGSTDSENYVKAEYSANELEGDNVGGVVGLQSGLLDTVEVSNITVMGTRRVGGVTGIAYNHQAITNINVSNVTVGTNATQDYANSKKTKMGIGGIVGLYVTYNNQVDGKLENASVSNITLTKPEGVTASLGYITGGETGTDTLPVKPTLTGGTDNITVNGTNSGENNTYLYNLADSQDKGNIRFITKVNSDDTVTAYGTYFALVGNEVSIQESNVYLEGNTAGQKTTFSADIMGVPENKLDTPIYAMSFIKIGDKAVWSPVKGASVNEYNHNKEGNE